MTDAYRKDFWRQIWHVHRILLTIVEYCRCKVESAIGSTAKHPNSSCSHCHSFGIRGFQRIYCQTCRPFGKVWRVEGLIFSINVSTSFHSLQHFDTSSLLILSTDHSSTKFQSCSRWVRFYIRRI